MPEEQGQKKSWFKGGLGVAFTLVKGLLIPLSVGCIGYAFAYPLNWLSCSTYANAIERPFKYSYFQCYIQTNNGSWLQKQEYEASQVGMKIILSVP